MNVGIIHYPEMMYPVSPPFDPEERYPEMPVDWTRRVTGEPNLVYRAVRESLFRLGLDREAFGTKAWNPLRTVARPGSRVLIKPNLVLHEPPTLVGTHALVTHASVIRPIVDYVILATGGDCRITIADCPLQEADLPRVLRANGLDALLSYYNDDLRVAVKFLDLRVDRITLRSDGFVEAREKAPGDPRGNQRVHLDVNSELEPVTQPTSHFSTSYRPAFAVALYDRDETGSHHIPGRHEYLIPQTVLDCDVFINVPKLKTHQKAGITVCLKNLVGINADKSYLPHYREGAVEDGGDEYPYRHWLTAANHRLRRQLSDGNPVAWLVMSRAWRLCNRALLASGMVRRESTFARNKGIGGGAWSGNDTLWRTILDINKILMHATADGTMHEEPQRTYLAVVDGVVAGERNGPILPTPKHAGVVLASQDPLALDVTAARLMGFDWTRIPQLWRAATISRYGFSEFRGRLADIDVVSNENRWERLFDHDEHLGFSAAPWWESIGLAPQRVAV